MRRRRYPPRFRSRDPFDWLAGALGAIATLSVIVIFIIILLVFRFFK